MTSMVAGANQLFNLVFFIVLSPVALQDPTLNAVARHQPAP